MSNYIRNKAKAIYVSDKPSLADQSAAAATDINIIVRQLERTGVTRGSPIPGMSADTVGVPDNLRDALESVRGINLERSKLPPALRDLTLEQLMGLTIDQLKAKLQPPAQQPDSKKDDTK